MKKIVLMACALAFAGARAEDSAWVQLWNGKDLADWVPKFSGQKLGVNVDSVFGVKDGLLNVTVSKNVGYGHLFYNKRAFSYFIARVEYKFPADKSAAGYPDWTIQNNGLMILCQTPSSMDIGQDYPNSIEVQLLGPKSTTAGGTSSTWPVGHTANVCTPGTFIAYKGNNNYTTHCTTSEYPDAWKTTHIPWDKEYSNVTARILSDSLDQHYINGVKVMEYSKVRLDNGTAVKQGYISIQAEGTSTQFRKIEILDLVGCMDKNSPAYRSYFVKNDAAACGASSLARSAGPSGFAIAPRQGSVEVTGPGFFSVEARRADGALVVSASGRDRVSLEIPRERPGVLYIRVRKASGRAVAGRIIAPL